MRIGRAAGFLTVAFCLVSPVTTGHHSFAARFDRMTIEEMDGIVTEVFWRNPHVYLTVEVTDPAGERVSWELETNTAARLERSGINADTIQVGDSVKVAGYPPRTAAREMYATNLLLPSGEELLLNTSATARWSQKASNDRWFETQTAGDASQAELGIFRVWSKPGTAPNLFPSGFVRGFDVFSLPLTESARAAVEVFDPLTDSPTADCRPKGMAQIMAQPYPIEFSEHSENILLRLEEYDTVRTIRLGDSSISDDAPATLLGYSFGRWEGDALVVETTRVSYPYFNAVGVPLSEAAEIVERFTPTADGSRLDYEMIVTDPVNFTAPVVRNTFWLYLPGQEVKPYNCAVRN